MSIPAREVLARGTAQLQAAGIESARLDARVLLAQALGISSAESLPAEPTPGQAEIFESLIARRAAREPLAYITGRKEFWSLEFEVGPGVLIPRPETETLIEEALRHFPARNEMLSVLDIGTGSGCLLIALLKERPGAHGVGIDISGEALAFARRNATRHDLDDRCSFELGEVQELSRDSSSTDPSHFRASAQKFDLILANPPYLTDEEFLASQWEIREFEPRLAFAAGSDGFEAFRAFLPLVARWLSPGGMAFFEIGAGQMEAVGKIVMNSGLEVRHVRHDLCGVPRCLAIGRAEEGSWLAP